MTLPFIQMNCDFVKGGIVPMVECELAVWTSEYGLIASRQQRGNGDGCWRSPEVGEVDAFCRIESARRVQYVIARSTHEASVKNVVAKPLDELQPFIGEWTTEGRHVAVPNEVIRGHCVFEWWGDRTFLMHRSTVDHPDFPDNLSIMGATRPDGGLALHWFDSRGTHRVFDMTFERGVWTISRKAAGPKDFDQSMRGTFSADGNTIMTQSSLSEPGGGPQKPDFAVTFTRVAR
jgi:hypothetical protein